jgi:hypothetical protein
MDHPISSSRIEDFQIIHFPSLILWLMHSSLLSVDTPKFPFLGLRFSCMLADIGPLPMLCLHPKAPASALIIQRLE